MQSFSDFFANNRLLAIGIVLAAIAVILAVGIALFRLVFGRRLHMAGGRTRQPRLGVVDAFDLDRQRQLVLIRRDNVEHLLMIGGPNDVLIEAAIVRTSAPVAGRDKDAGFTPSVGIPAPMPQQAAAALPPAAAASAGGADGGSSLPVPSPVAPEPRVLSAAEQTRPVAAIEPVPAPVVTPAPNPVATPEPRLPSAATLPPAGTPRPGPVTPRQGATLPPRPPVSPVARPAATPTPRTNLSRATPLPASSDSRPSPGRAEPPSSRQTPETTVPADRSPSEATRDAPSPMRFPPPRNLRNEEPVATSAAPEPSRPAQTPQVPSNAAEAAAPPSRPPSPPRATPTGPMRTLPPRPAPTGAPAQPSLPPAPAPAPVSPSPRNPMPSLGSLEEEMAKLLGRPMPPSDTSGSGH